MSNGTDSPPVEVSQRQPQYGPGADQAQTGEPFPMSVGKQAPMEEVVKSYDPEEGYLTRHEPSVVDLISVEGAPYSEADRNRFDVNKSLIEAAKEFLFIADQAGEPRSASSTPGIVHMTWDDGSAITIRFEARRGELGAASGYAVGPERAARNRAFDRNKQIWESARQQKQEARPDQPYAQQEPAQQTSGVTEPH